MGPPPGPLAADGAGDQPCFLALFATFAILGERALQDSTDRLLKERLVIAQMAARQLDERLQQATAQLQQAQRFVGFDPANPDRSAEAHVLAVISTRVGQTLTAVQLSLDRLARALPTDDPGPRERLDRGRMLKEQALADLRRMIVALRPGVLDQLACCRPWAGWPTTPCAHSA